MSHSRIFDEYAKLMTEKGLLKTAGKKDEDYNVVSDKAGPDTVVEETGWELVEAAHPEQIQVAESRLNDGIVENGVEQQKAMVDVALRNPRGVIASLMQTLVKAANLLEEDLTEESLKIAKEVDDFLFVLAQQSQVVLSPEAAKQLDDRHLPQFKNAVEEAINRFQDLDWSTFYETRDDPEAKYGESVVNDALKKLNVFVKQTPENLVGAAHVLAQYINQFYKMVRSAIQKSKDWGNDQNEAVAAWDNLKAESDEWLTRGYRAAPARVPSEQTAPGVASKEKGLPSQIPHHYSVRSPEVGQLQDLLGLTGNARDEKFGPKTYSALVQTAKTNSLLAQLLANKPKGYEGWRNVDIGEAIQRIQEGNTSASEVSNSKSEILNPYPEG